MSANDGGPVASSYRKSGTYPHDLSPFGGMTLRDQFAAAALTGMVAHHGNIYPESGAVDAYKWADAMLAAREAK
jgi:hypothetical protein